MPYHRARAALCAICAILLLLRPASGDGGWEKYSDKSGIRVYTRYVPGTELMEFMGVTTIDARMEVIGAVLRDAPSFPRWVADCYEGRTLKTIDHHTFVMQMLLKPPFINEREVNLKNTTTFDLDHGRVTISFFCYDDPGAVEIKGRTRIEVMYGSFEMEYLGREKTRFIYRLAVDPAGSIPKRLAYAVMKKSPHRTLTKLRTVVADPRYAVAAKGSSEEVLISALLQKDTGVKKILRNRLMKHVRKRETLRAIIRAESDAFAAIMSAGGTYDSIKKASGDLLFKYLDRIVGDGSILAKMKTSTEMRAEIEDMIMYDCPAVNISIDGIAARYRKKYTE